MRKIAIALLLAAALMIPSIQGYSAGITGSVVDSGCTCHGGGAPSSDATLLIDGVPDVWNVSEEYILTITLDAPEAHGINQGGFNLQANYGELVAVDDNVKIVDGQATHTDIGNDLREWNVKWIAPSKAGKTVKFTVLSNGVNGDAMADSSDHWTKSSTLSQSVEIAGEGEDVPGWDAEKTGALILGLFSAAGFIILTEGLRDDELEE